MGFLVPHSAVPSREKRSLMHASLARTNLSLETSIKRWIVFQPYPVLVFGLGPRLFFFFKLNQYPEEGKRRIAFFSWIRKHSSFQIMRCRWMMINWQRIVTKMSKLDKDLSLFQDPFIHSLSRWEGGLLGGVCVRGGGSILSFHFSSNWIKGGARQKTKG